MLTAFVTVALYTGSEAKAQGNATAAAGANMTKGNMTKGNMSTAGKAMVIGAMNKTK